MHNRGHKNMLCNEKNCQRKDKAAAASGNRYEIGYNAHTTMDLQSRHRIFCGDSSALCVVFLVNGAAISDDTIFRLLRGVLVHVARRTSLSNE